MPSSISNVLLSICIPTYNRSERVVNIINQIIPFQGEEIEIVISDDASSDGTREAVKKIKDPRIKYFRNKKNLGFDLNILKMIKRATGEFVFILMDDDDIEMEAIPWILKTIKSNRNLTQLCGTIGIKIPGYGQIFHEFGDRILSSGYESLNELLFYYYHGSGIVLRRKALDLKRALRYVGFLFMQQVLIGQAMMVGDTLCTSKKFAYIGEIPYKSGQPLFKGTDFTQPLHRIYQIKFRIQLIDDITNGMKNLRRALFYRQKNKIYYIIGKNTTKSFKRFIEILSIVFLIKQISWSPRFWINLIYSIIHNFFKKSK